METVFRCGSFCLFLPHFLCNIHTILDFSEGVIIAVFCVQCEKIRGRCGIFDPGKTQIPCKVAQTRDSGENKLVAQKSTLENSQKCLTNKKIRIKWKWSTQLSFSVVADEERRESWESGVRLGIIPRRRMVC